MQPPGDPLQDERQLREALPRPPRLENIATSGVWIAQWRPEHGPRPGSALHRWLEARHPGWSRLVDCHGRTDVVSAIKAATWLARDGKASPILHLDADCDARGLAGPARDGGSETVPWEELAPHLARLNVATRGNLVLVCSAGEGVAAQLAAAARERSPCMAVIAPATAAPPPPAPWLMALQRLYRCWHDGQPGLEEASASLAPARMEAVSMPAELHARLVSDLLAATRPGERAAAGGPAALLAALGADGRGVGSWAALPRRLQRHWRSLFMADLYPDNLSRFDFDLKSAAWRILLARGLA